MATASKPRAARKSADAEWKALKREFRTQIVILGGLLASFVLIELVDQVVFQGRLDAWGVRPREIAGLVGILLAPFLHGGFAHLLANALPFAVLGWLIVARDIRDFFLVSLVVLVTGGLGTWAIGAPGSVHVGSSGLIFGYFAFLLTAGWFERRIGPVIVSVLVFLSYGGLLFGLLPGTPGVSWPMHLFGFVGGVIAARLLARGERKESTRR